MTRTQIGRQRISKLHPDAPRDLPFGLRPKRGVEYGCGDWGCAQCYESDLDDDEIADDGGKRMVRPIIWILFLLAFPALASAETTQTLTASAYGRVGCRAALFNVSKVADSQGVHTWANYTIWTCAPGATNPEQVVTQRSVLIPDGQFTTGQGNSQWALALETADGSVTLRWAPDGRVHSTYDAAWTSSISGQTPTKTTKSLTTDSAPPIGVLFGVSPEAVSGTIMRGSDISR